MTECHWSNFDFNIPWINTVLYQSAACIILDLLSAEDQTAILKNSLRYWPKIFTDFKQPAKKWSNSLPLRSNCFVFVIKRDLKENCFEHLHQFVSSTEHQNYVSEIEFSGRITCITSHLYITESNNNAICYFRSFLFLCIFQTASFADEERFGLVVYCGRHLNVIYPFVGHVRAIVPYFSVIINFSCLDLILERLRF